MKKLIFTLALVIAFGGISASHVSADTCGLQPDNSYIPCGNGPVVPMPLGWRHLNIGQEDCPTWMIFAGCMTPNR